VAAGRQPGPTGTSIGVSPRRSRQWPSNRQGRRCLASRARSRGQQPALPAHEQPEAPRGCGPTTGPRGRLPGGVTVALTAPAIHAARQALSGKSSQQLLPAAGPPGARAARSAPWLRADHRSARAAPWGCHRGAPGAGHPAGKAGAAWQAEPTATATSRCSGRMRSPRAPWLRGDHWAPPAAPWRCHRGARSTCRPTGKAGVTWQVGATAAASEWLRVPRATRSSRGRDRRAVASASPVCLRRVAAFSQRLPAHQRLVSSPMPNRLIELTNGPAALTTGSSPAEAGLNRVLPSLRLRFAPRRTLGCCVPTLTPEA
jgi:hypothetical protein